jgi:hypothetical protein
MLPMTANEGTEATRGRGASRLPLAAAINATRTAIVVVTVRREGRLDFSGCDSRVAADKAASLGGENPTAVNCLLQTASMPDARKGNGA